MLKKLCFLIPRDRIIFSLLLSLLLSVTPVETSSGILMVSHRAYLLNNN